MKKIAKDEYFALAVFLMDYHSGQWSRGYRLLSKFRIGGFSSRFCEEMREEPIYSYLVEKYSHTV